MIRTATFNLRGALAHKPDQVERYGQLIHEQSRRLASLVDQILHFASSEAGHVIRERASVAPATVIEDALRASLASVDDPELIVDKQLSSDLPPILADEQALRQALQNLMENALKYGIEQSNWIGIFASAVTDAHGSAVEIRVADRGPGIPRDEQTRIFDPFFRGQARRPQPDPRRGIGSKLVKKIVEAHGGALRVISEPFERTEFIITIPPRRQSGNMSSSILLVEDEPGLVLTVSDLLATQGHTVKTALDGESGLQLAKSGDFDLVILDVMLPRKDGFEVCRQLRQQGIAPPSSC